MTREKTNQQTTTNQEFYQILVEFLFNIFSIFVEEDFAMKFCLNSL